MFNRKLVVLAGFVLLQGSAHAQISFEAPMDLNAAGPVMDAVTVDIDQDGWLDLVVTLADTPSTTTGAVQVLLGQGTNCRFTHFDPLPESAAGLGTACLAVGDLNGDIYPDVVVTNMLDGSLSIYHGDPGGALLPAATIVVGGTPRDIAIGNFIGTHPARDVAFVDAASGTIRMLFNDGAAVSTTTVSIPIGNPGTKIELDPSQVDPDDQDELIVLPEDGDVISIDLTLLGDEASRMYYAMGSAARLLAAADLDGDTSSEVITANFDSGNAALYVLRDGQLDEIPLGFDPSALGTDDVDGDGDVDVVVGHADTAEVSVFENDGNGSLLAPVTFAVAAVPSVIAPGDFHPDGRAGFVSFDFSGAGTARLGGRCADIDCDGSVGLSDMLGVFAAWGTCSSCIEDLDFDGLVDMGDIAIVSSWWGPCPD